MVMTLDVGAKLSNLGPVLDVLERDGVRATVFVYTAELEADGRGAGLVRRMAAAGHELANHTASHADLTKLSADEVESELDRAEAFVLRVTGRTTRPFFREPFLATNDLVDRIVRERCYRSIWFTVDTGDWRDGMSADAIVRKTLRDGDREREILPGSIFIFHGSQPANVEALPRVVAELRRRGFGFLTLGEALRRGSGVGG